MLGEMPVISQKSVYYIESVVDKLKYIDNISFDVIINGDEHIDLTKPFLESNRTFGGRFTMFFDIDESKTNDLKYMLNVIDDATFTYMFILDDIFSYETGNGMELRRTDDEENYATITQDVVREIHYHKTSQHFYTLTEALKIFGCDFNDEQMTNVFKDARKMSTGMWLNLLKCGFKPGVINNLSFKRVKDDEGRSIMQITIPEGKSVCLDEAVIGMIPKITVYDDVCIVVNGTLTVKNIDGLLNLRFLDKETEHNMIRLNVSRFSGNANQYLLNNFKIKNIL